jgi:biopolymer transport protein ExbB/TolQ
VTKGISEALLCTAGGLIVAAMSTVEYNYFVARVNSFALKVQVAGTALVERVLHARYRARNQAALEAVPA